MSPEVSIPVPGGGEVIMAEATSQFAALHDQNMAAMGQQLAQFQGNAVTVSKATDYDYLQAKDLPSLVESLGAEQVMARSTPSGPVVSTPIV